MRRDRNVIIILSGITLIGLLLRLWGTNHGLGDKIFTHPDEFPIAYQSRGFAMGFFGIPSWYYSPLWTYLQSLGVYLWSFLEGSLKFLLGIRDSIVEIPDVFGVLLIGRVMAGAIGTMTIPFVYLIGKRLFDKKIGFISAGMMAVIFLHVVESHYSYLDVPQGFFLTISFYFMVRVSMIDNERKTLVIHHSFLSGLLLGMAMATKINAAPGFVSLILSHYLREKGINKLIRSKYLYISTAGLILGYGIWVPYFWIEPMFFYMTIKDVLKVIFGSPGGLEVINGFIQEGRLFYDVFGPVFIFILFLILGIGISLLKKDKNVLFLFSFPLAYLPFTIIASWHAPRELVPLIPFLVIAASYGLSQVAGLFSKGKGPIFFILISLFLLTSLWTSLKSGYFLWQKDTRVLAAEWIKENIPPGAKIGIEGYSVYNPPVYYEGYSLLGDFSKEDVEGLKKKVDFIILSSTVYGQLNPYQKSFYDSLEERGYLIKLFRTKQVDFANPTIKLFKLSHQGGKFSSLIPRPYWEDGGIYDLSFGEGPYGKEPLSFWIGPKERIKRVILSEKGLDTVAILLYNGSEKTVLNIKGASKRRITLKPYEGTVVTFKPSRSFPFIRYTYNISIGCGRGGSFVRILTEPKAIAHALLESGDWKGAITALKGHKDQEAYSLLGLAYSMGEQWNEALGSFKKGLTFSIRDVQGSKEWEKSFEGLTNIDSAFLKDSLTVNYNAEKLYSITGKKMGPIAYFDPEVDKPGYLLFGPYKRFPAGAFRAVFKINAIGPGGSPAARIDVYAKEIITERRVRNSGGRFEEFFLDFCNEGPEEPLEFRVEALGAKELWVEEIKVFPDIQGNYKRFLGMIHHYWGLSALKSGLFEEAMEHFKIAGDLGYKDTEGFYQMGRVYEEMGIKEEAIRAYRRVIGDIPNHIDSLLALRRLRYRGAMLGEKIKALTPEYRIGQNFGDYIEFIGYSIDKERLCPGEEFDIFYFWRSSRKIRVNYFIFVHFRSDGATIFQNDHYPFLETKRWRKGGVVREDYTLKVPPDAPAGNYDIIIGVWDPEGSKERLMLNGQKTDEIRIGSIEVIKENR